ncbi:MAG TPA: hypothetical protein VID19_02825 [Candidatus Eremiobacteraceae bacterium]|jgi:hypothetical protein
MPTYADARALLRGVKRPHVLANFPCMENICLATGVDDPARAALALVDSAFNLATPHGRRLRESIIRCEVRGATTQEAAQAMFLSTRQFFRYRAEAMAAVDYALARIAPARHVA